MGRLFEEKYIIRYDKYSLDIYIPMIRMTSHEALVIGTCIMNIREGGEPKNI